MLSSIRWLVCLCLFLFMSCSSESTDKDMEAYKAAIRSLHERNLSVVERHGYNPSGVGGAFMDDIKWLKYSVDSDEMLSLREARSRLVRLSEDVLVSTNGHEQSRCYFHSYPMQIEQFQIGISSSPAYTAASDEAIVYVSMTKGVIYYYTMPDPKGRHVRVHEEPFAEAQRIVRSEQDHE